MKTCTRLTVRRGLFFVLLCANLWPAALSRAAVGLTLNPPSVSNTYSGTITLQVTGLTSGETVVVQKFLDANTNGVIDGADLLMQQFNLTDGQASVIGGVTNLNIPGDTGTTAGQITAQLNIQNGDLTFVGSYAYKVSSPTGNFPPITNLFTVTAVPYPQSFTGNVVNSGTNVPNAVVILFQPESGGGGGNPQGGAVANNSGSYTIKAAPGNYQLVAFKSNYVGDLSGAPSLTLGSGATISTNLTLINSTRSISGKIVDAVNSSIGLPGLLVPVTSANGLLAVGFTDSNGNFTVPVTASYWKIERDESALGFYGYLSARNKTSVDTSAGSVAGVTIALPKATALFYGSVKDNLNQPLAGVELFSEDNNNQYEGGAATDQNGNYFAGALGGGTWRMQIDNNQNASLANYIFSQPLFNQNGGTNLSVGQAVQVNFTAILGTNHITGHVQDSDGIPILGLQVHGSASINGATYQAQAYTDSSGNYSMNVPNGNWGVSVCCGCNDCNDCLSSSAYQCPNSQNVNIANNNGTVNFTVQICNGVQITTASPLPDGQVGYSYYTQFQAASCNNNFYWLVNDPANLPPGLNLDSGGAFNGTPTASGTFNFSVHVLDGNGNSTDQSFSLFINSTPLQVTTTSLPGGTNGAFYSQQLNASGGQQPYSWSLAPYSGSLPPNLTLANNGVLSGTLATSGTFYFYARVTDAAAPPTTADSSSPLQLSIANQPLQIASVSLPSGTVGATYSAQLVATGGQPPYGWSLAAGSASLPQNLTLSSGGGISGTPTTNGTFNFIVRATDAGSTSKTKPLSLIINPQPVLGSPNWLTNRFQIRLTGVTGQNYTVQMSTNASSTSWTTLFITNNATTNSFLVADPNATNNQRFYRTLVGP